MLPKDPNINRKLEMQYHNEPKGIFPEDSLENMIDSTKMLVLGKFVYVFLQTFMGEVYRTRAENRQG